MEQIRNLIAGGSEVHASLRPRAGECRAVLQQECRSVRRIIVCGIPPLRRARTPPIFVVAGVISLILGALAGPALASGSPSDSSLADQARAYVAAHAAAIPAEERATGTGIDNSCFSAVDNSVNPEVNSSGEPTNPAWFERDALNVYCSTE